MATNTIERIKIEKRSIPGLSYYVDASGMLKGEWGGFHEACDIGPNGEIVHELYYERFPGHGVYIPINEFGYFYNLFSCKKYDSVLKITQELYLCKKNSKFGVVDINGKELLHTCYNNIRVSPGASCDGRTIYETSFIVTCETGDFIYDLETNKESDLFDEILYFYHDNNDYLLIRNDSKYGIINRKGDVIVEPKYEKKEHHTWSSDNCELQVLFHGRKYDLPMNNEKFYGIIPIDVYDRCIKIRRGRESELQSQFQYYIIQKDNKYGILRASGEINRSLQIIIEPCLDNVFLNDDGCFSSFGFVIGEKSNKYMLMDIDSGKCIIKNCKKIAYEGPYFSFQKGKSSGIITPKGMVINMIEYEKVEGNTGIKISGKAAEFFVTKNGKKGILGYDGKLILPCDYDEIKYKWGRVYEVVKNGVMETIDLRPEKDDYYYNNEQESPCYSRYRGSYAQDEMGYSDDDIDTIFDGDPSAYWNID